MNRKQTGNSRRMAGLIWLATVMLAVAAGNRYG